MADNVKPKKHQFTLSKREMQGIVLLTTAINMAMGLLQLLPHHQP